MAATGQGINLAFGWEIHLNFLSTSENISQRISI